MSAGETKKQTARVALERAMCHRPHGSLLRHEAAYVLGQLRDPLAQVRTALDPEDLSFAAQILSAIKTRMSLSGERFAALQAPCETRVAEQGQLTLRGLVTHETFLY